MSFNRSFLRLKSFNQYSVFKVQIHLTSFHEMNGDGEIRTLDPLLARQVLSQLSYTPFRYPSGIGSLFFKENPAATCSPISSPT